MYDDDSTQDRGLTTEQIANAGNEPTQPDGPGSARHRGYPDDADGQDYPQEGAVRQDYAQEGAVGQDYPDNAVGQDYPQEGAVGQDYPQDDAVGQDYPQEGAVRQDYPQEGAVRQDYPDNAAAPVADQAAGPGQRARLLDEGELQNLTARWKDIQAEFVEEPTEAVQQADALVAELMQRLAATFAAERAELESRWAGGNEVSTEDLRQGLRLYHSFFQRLLAA